MSINVALLKRICETPGVPGHEQKVRELITQELKGVVDDNKAWITWATWLPSKKAKAAIRK